MSLNDLNQSLYDPDSEAEKRTHKENQFDPNLSKPADTEEFQRKEEWIKEKKGLTSGQKRAIKIGLWVLGGVIFLALLVVAVYKIKQSAFSEDRVSIFFDGPADVDSTQLTRYVIRYKNDNRANLSNAEILLNYPENYQPEAATNLQIINASNSRIDLGKVEPHSEEEIILEGKFYAPKNYVAYLRVTLRYTPSNFNSVFQAQSQLGVNIKTSPISLEVAAPLEAADNNDVEYVVDYKNSSSLDFNDVRVKAEYPDGFQFVSSQPQSSEGNNFWYIGNLGAGQGGKILIRGKLQGSGDEGKIIKVFAGSSGSGGQFVIYTQNEKITRIITSPLSITQSVNGLKNLSVNPGEKLDYVINYRNNSEIGLRDAIVTAEIKSAVLDFSKLQLQKGFYDSSRETITWKASDFPGLANLAPGNGGEIRFSIPVLSRVPVKTENDKNFTIVTVAKIDSPDVPTPIGSNKIIASDTLELKLNSKVVLETLGYYKDSAISNSGPVPPEVGKETSYTIHWKILNVSNDVADAKVVSTLPTGVKWLDKISPAGEKMTYNERTNQIIWEIGKLENGTGILGPKREVSFQVSIIPQVNQAGKEAPILGLSLFTAKDLFTAKELNLENQEKNTMLTEDPSIGNDGYRVVGAAPEAG